MRLRWAAVGLLAGATAAAHLAGSLRRPVALYITAGVLALVNFGLARLGVWLRDGELRALRRGTCAQILVDLVALTAALHWSGGVDNPFVSFYVFPVALAGMLLTPRAAFTAAGVAIALHGIMLGLMSVGLVEHEPVLFGATHLHDALDADANWKSSLFVFAHLVAFSTTQLGVAYFVGTLAQRRRDAERRRRAQEQTVRARERLARVGTLAAGVAHTVRNPLHGLLNCVALLRDAPGLGPDDAEVLDLMDDGVQRIERVTRRLLAFSREGPGRREVVDAAVVVEDATRMVRLLARDAGVELQTHLDPVPPLTADADRLVEALVNVLHNAVQASPSGGLVRVSLRVDTELGEGGRVGGVILQVEDTGPGISEDLRAKVVEPFFTTKAVGQGTGLGLAITRRILDDHGGRLEIGASDLGGARVALHVPLAASPEPWGPGAP